VLHPLAARHTVPAISMPARQDAATEAALMG
jgi:hypothetical protein